MLPIRQDFIPGPVDPDALRAASDEVLFTASRDGDELAFRTLVERHATLVQRLALNIVRDEQEAEDVAQEVFVSAWRKRLEWKPEAKFTTWLYRIAVNKAIDRYRMRRAAPESPEVITRIADAAVCTLEAPQQHQALERTEVAKSLHAALETLPASQRTALRLFYFEDLDVAKIATAMVTSEQSVRSLLKRGRQTLRTRLQRQKNLCADGSSAIPATAHRAGR
ncbi:MAG: polymerase subunit sigma-24 [Phenylobacterium sp.]|nr:polymerase subunit sigma-24 [Phenylobacterium sp.]